MFFYLKCSTVTKLIRDPGAMKLSFFLAAAGYVWILTANQNDRCSASCNLGKMSRISCYPGRGHRAAEGSRMHKYNHAKNYRNRLQDTFCRAFVLWACYNWNGWNGSRSNGLCGIKVMVGIWKSTLSYIAFKLHANLVSFWNALEKYTRQCLLPHNCD